MVGLQIATTTKSLIYNKLELTHTVLWQGLSEMETVPPT